MLPAYPISHKTVDLVSYYCTHRKLCLVCLRDIWVCMSRKPEPDLITLQIIKGRLLDIVEQRPSAPKCDCLNDNEHSNFMRLVHLILNVFEKNDDDDHHLFFTLAFVYAAITMHIDNYKIEMPDYFRQFYNVDEDEPIESPTTEPVGHGT